ncbi:MAG: SDR family oxidoreductase [Acidobacteriota bacterium]
MEIEFKEKVILITGGSRGIGRAIAKKFADSGGIVIINFNTNKEEAEITLDELNGSGHNAVKCDITDPVQVEKMVERVIHEYGRIDILVNNAGIYEEIDMDKTEYEEWMEHWERTVSINLIGPANLTFKVVEAMKTSGGGKIINITSRGAFRGEPDAPAYGASKAGLNSFSQSMAKALAPYNIYFYAVAPGYVETDMTTEILNSERGDAIRAQSPLNRVALPEEVAHTTLLLASGGTEFMTGTIVDINGASYLRS